MNSSSSSRNFTQWRFKYGLTKVEIDEVLLKEIALKQEDLL